MSMYGYVGLCIAMYVQSYVCVLRAVYGYGVLCMLFRAVYGYVGICMAMYVYV